MKLVPLTVRTLKMIDTLLHFSMRTVSGTDCSDLWVPAKSNFWNKGGRINPVFGTEMEYMEI